MSEPVNRKKMMLADISLVFVALFWGSNFVVMKQAFEVIEPFTYLSIRFLLGAFLLALIFWKRLVKTTVADFKAGLIIGFFLFAGYIAQTIGLLYTTPAKSGFITGTAVIIVPFLFIFVTRRSPGWWTFLGATIAAAGLYFLSVDKATGFGFGDGLTLIGAFLFAAHLIAIAVYVKESDPIVLSIIQIGSTGLVCLIIALITEPTAGMFSHSLATWGAILYAVLFCTIGAFVTQTVAQRYTPPTHAVLILSTEAVFAGIFSYLFWDEQFTLQKIIGALLILAGILITEMHPILAAKFATQRRPAS